VIGLDSQVYDVERAAIERHIRLRALKQRYEQEQKLRSIERQSKQGGLIA
jgi:hypothetical protein